MPHLASLTPGLGRRSVLRARVLALALAAVAVTTGASGATAAAAAAAAAGPVEPTPRIVVDGFGYLPSAPKSIVVRRPQIGYDAADGPDDSLPGPAIEIRRIDDGSVALTAPLVPWNGGEIDPASGDRVWRADVSALTEPGRYVAVDPETGDASVAFRIDGTVLHDAARAAVRMYLYQRCGTGREVAHVGPGFDDPPCHLADAACRFIGDPSGVLTRDLSGGWHDAGDFNKYVNFCDDVIHELLGAWETAPHLFTDDFNLPESGNGIPDLLDEVRWELEWLRRMQVADGSVLHKVSRPSYGGEGPPSADTSIRYHASPTATATMSVAGVFARAAGVFGDLGDPEAAAFAADLEARAVAAWNWVEANPAAWAATYDNDGGLFTTVAAEDSDYERAANRMRAAVHLWSLTGEAAYREVVDEHHDEIHVFAWFTAIPFEHVWHEALLRYAATPGATPAVAAAIRDQLAFAVSRPDAIGRFVDDADAYRAFLEPGWYVWGSNRVRAHVASGLALAERHDLVDLAEQAPFVHAAAGHLHAIHGVNPLGRMYLSAMASYGVENSITEIYHGWFADGTIWDSAQSSPVGPAPGFLVGGPNPTYEPALPMLLEPPMNQPAAKSYRDWNADWPEASWQITEPHIPYQSAYIRLIADVAAGLGGACAASGPEDVDCDGAIAFSDLVAVLAAWGPCTGDCRADVDGDGAAGFGDLLAVLAAWS